MSKPVKNMAHSVAARLLAIAAESKTAYEFILLRYGQERLLYRMSQSKYFNTFILKGASLFLVWQGHFYRTTRDIDFLGIGSSDPESIQNEIKVLCQIDTIEVDGLRFDPTTVKTTIIQDNQDYTGVRVNFSAFLDRSRINLQIDIGFGDAVTPAPEQHHFPSLLDIQGPSIKIYPKYTAMAEKFLAMSRLGIDNSRMKDYYDMVVMFRMFDFDYDILATAIINTCRARKFSLTKNIPVGLTKEFSENPTKIAQWQGFSKRAGLIVPVGRLSEVVDELQGRLLPVFEKLHSPFFLSSSDEK